MIKNTSPILNALRAATLSETAAVEFFEKQRWSGVPACPLCGDVEVYQMMSGEERNKDYRWRCRGCAKMFTVRTGTVFAETRLPLRVWVYAIWKACSSKKGISALQLSREMEVTHKSALFILRRIRHGIGEVAPEKLTGTIEVDELYVGGKPRYKGISKHGRGNLVPIKINNRRRLGRLVMLSCGRSGRTQGPSTALRFGRDDMIEIESELRVSPPTLSQSARQGWGTLWLVD
jgi:transposase-like protein